MTTVAVLAKAPVAGLAKTRLIPRLGAEGAAALQARFIGHAVTAAAAAVARCGGQVALWGAPDVAHPVLQAAAAAAGAVARAQPAGDLGLRLAAAVAADIARGPVVLTGTDCPALTSAHLHAMLACLHNGIEAVAIPAEDGGYVALGLSRAVPAVFAGITWSTATVMAETRRRFHAAGLSYRTLPALPDVDEPSDYDRMLAMGLPGFGA
jgi:hypothetical protein